MKWVRLTDLGEGQWQWRWKGGETVWLDLEWADLEERWLQVMGVWFLNLDAARQQTRAQVRGWSLTLEGPSETLIFSQRVEKAVETPEVASITVENRNLRRKKTGRSSSTGKVLESTRKKEEEEEENRNPPGKKKIKGKNPRVFY